jgi:hypothetical protein
VAHLGLISLFKSLWARTVHFSELLESHVDQYPDFIPSCGSSVHETSQALGLPLRNRFLFFAKPRRSFRAVPRSSIPVASVKNHLFFAGPTFCHPRGQSRLDRRRFPSPSVLLPQEKRTTASHVAFYCGSFVRLNRWCQSSPLLEITVHRNASDFTNTLDCGCLSFQEQG